MYQAYISSYKDRYMNYLLKEIKLSWNVLKLNDFKVRSHICQKSESRILIMTLPYFFRAGTVGLYVSNYTFKITIFVNVWNLGQFRDKCIFVNNCLIKVRI